ncbi:MAG TPA: transglutaminase family protein, partial [bacterium]|nr:transglutaminase family protein [bacterium]
HAFDVHVPHTELRVIGSSVVDTSAPPAISNSPSWSELADWNLSGQVAEMLAPTTYVPRVEELTEESRSLSGSGSPAEAFQSAADWVHSRLQYQRDTTDVSTTAVEALRMGTGVCQDFAHLTLALLRAMGIPARYTSGYVFPSPDAEVGEDVAGHSHAWVEAWLGDWCALDPTHGVPVGERHVVVARGRDYADVPPLKGVYRGGPAQSLGVSVELTRLG